MAIDDFQMGELFQEVKGIRTDVTEILKQTKITNGRVNVLEVSKADNNKVEKNTNMINKIIGIGVTIQIVIIPLVVLLFNHFIK